MRIQCNPLEKQINGKLDKMFQKKNAFVQVQPGNITLPSKYSEIGEAILDLEIRKDDVWVVSYPRTGKKFHASEVNVTRKTRFTTFYLCGKIQTMHK